MFTENRFYKTVIKIAIPVTLQSLLQSSFGVADQMMTGQLGSVSIAGIGLSSKFTSVFSVLVSAIAAVAGIMIAQYVGQKDDEEVSRCFCVNLFLAVILAVFFTMLSAMCPQIIMRIYTRDQTVRKVAAGYLRIVSVTYLPIAISSLTSVLLRYMEKADYQVESHVRMLACQILFAFALIAPVKVQNMILGGGIIRSGGKTKYIMWIDFVGTWLFGVPLGFLTAFVLKLEIPYVYFILSLEECVRLGISFVVFRKRNWMMQL